MTLTAEDAQILAKAIADEAASRDPAIHFAEGKREINEGLRRPTPFRQRSNIGLTRLFAPERVNPKLADRHSEGGDDQPIVKAAKARLDARRRADAKAAADAKKRSDDPEQRIAEIRAEREAAQAELRALSS